MDKAGNLTDFTGLLAGPGPGPGTGDFDNDGLIDAAEYVLRFLYPGLDPTVADTDGDGLSDGAEIYPTAPRLATNPTFADTDGDGYNDFVEDNSGVYGGAGSPGTSPTLSAGYARLSDPACPTTDTGAVCNPGIVMVSGTLIFQQTAAGRTYESAVPLDTSGISISMPVDNSPGYTTAFALLNPSTTSIRVRTTFIDEAGRPVTTRDIPLAGRERVRPRDYGTDVETHRRAAGEMLDQQRRDGHGLAQCRGDRGRALERTVE